MRLDCKDTVNRLVWMDTLHYVKLGRSDRSIRVDESTEGQNETEHLVSLLCMSTLYHQLTLTA